MPDHTVATNTSTKQVRNLSVPFFVRCFVMFQQCTDVVHMVCAHGMPIETCMVMLLILLERGFKQHDIVVQAKVFVACTISY